ncbi:hypothetical protein MNBD_NITROSPINAE03-2080 [hydrothermal vent metagenome]|uniref:Uncharacterized protein n=1 Tax=hydrothermal vent metagenome TaxID=652676 RepID=A0A3B1BTV0_9ZZZZ
MLSPMLSMKIPFKKVSLFIIGIVAYALTIVAPVYGAVSVKRCHMEAGMSGHDVMMDVENRQTYHVEPVSMSESDPDMKEAIQAATAPFRSLTCPLGGKSRFDACPRANQRHSGKGCCLKNCGDAIPGQDGFLVFSNFYFLVSEISDTATLAETGQPSPGILSPSTRPDNPDPRPPQIS